MPNIGAQPGVILSGGRAARAARAAEQAIVETDIPARLDRLPWGRFHSLLGAALMIAGGLIAWKWGVDAERKSLETVARPLTIIDID